MKAWMHLSVWPRGFISGNLKYMALYITVYKPQVAYMSYHIVLAGRSGKSRLRDTLGRESFCPHMANDAYIKIHNCHHWAEQSTRNLHQKQFCMAMDPDPFHFCRHRHTGFVTQDESFQSSCTCFDIAILKIVQSHSIHQTNLDVRSYNFLE